MNVTARRLTKGLAVAPADRAAGRRGTRGPLTFIAVVAALGLLVMRSEQSGSGQTARVTYEYRLDGPAWADPVILGLALGVVALALALWAARSRPVVVVSLVLLPCALGAGVAVVLAKRTSGRIEPEEVRGAKAVSTKSELRDLLGAPAGHGDATLRQGRADCLVYVGARKDRFGDRPNHFFCFRDGRLTAWRSP